MGTMLSGVVDRRASDSDWNSAAMLPALETCFDSSVVVVPHLNRGLLGDKIVLSAVTEWLAKKRPAIEVIGIEGEEALSMARYRHPPTEFRRGEVARELEILARQLRSHRNWSVWLLGDHNSVRWSGEGVRSGQLYVGELWTYLKALAQEGVFPRLQVDDHARELAWERLRRRFGSEPYQYVTLHVRRLSREPWKNGSEARARAIAQRLVKEVGCRVVLVGREDQYDEIRGEGVADLRGMDMDLAGLSGLLAGATLHIGGDSGPTHLAAAVGTRLCCVDYRTTRFGPFVRPGQIVARFGARRTEGIVELKDCRQIVEAVARSVGTADYVQTGTHQNAQENAA